MLMFNLDFEFGELAISHLGGGTGHEIAPFLSFRESNHVADAVGSREEHDNSIETKGDAEVGRCAILEGFDEKSKFILDVFFGELHNTENLFLELAVVDPLRAATYFIAIEDNIIGEGSHFEGILIKEMNVVGMRSGEGVVLAFDETFLGIVTEERKICDPQEAEFTFRDYFSLMGDTAS